MRFDFEVLANVALNTQVIGDVHVHSHHVFTVRNNYNTHVFVVAAAVFSSFENEESHVECDVVRATFSARDSVEFHSFEDENEEAEAAVAFVTEQMASHL